MEIGENNLMVNEMRAREWIQPEGIEGRACSGVFGGLEAV